MSNLQRKLEDLQLHESVRQHKSKQQIMDLRDSTDNTLEGFQRDLRCYQTEVNNLKSELAIKESHLMAISRDKDALQNQLDEKTIQHEDLKSKFRDIRSQLDQLWSTKSNQEERVQQCMSEIRVLQNRVRESESESVKLKSRLDAEKSLSRETRIENMKLKEGLYL